MATKVTQFNCMNPFIQLKNLYALEKTRNFACIHIPHTQKRLQYFPLTYEEVTDYDLRVLKHALVDKNWDKSTCLGRTVIDSSKECEHALSSINVEPNKFERMQRDWPELQSVIVTRWEDVPFPCGSYSLFRKGADLGK